MKSLNVTNISVYMSDARSRRISVGWDDADGMRYHYWSVDPDHLDPQDDVIYKNPPNGTPHRGEGYFNTRRLSIFSQRWRPVVESVAEYAREEGLVAKEIARLEAEAAAEEEKHRQSHIRSIKKDHAERMYEALRQLADRDEAALALLAEIDDKIAEVK